MIMHLTQKAKCAILVSWNAILESLKNELEAIAHWDRGLIFQDSISALDHLFLRTAQRTKARN